MGVALTWVWALLVPVEALAQSPPAVGPTGGQATATAAPAPAQAAPPAPPGGVHQEAHQGTDSGEGPSLRLVGFADVNFATAKRTEGVRGFSLGQFALHMTSSLSTRVTFFGELSFTARPDAGTGSPAATGFNAEVERLILRFDQSDQLKVSFGRYHTPVNWWNTAYHHGQWLQTTIARPEMTQFGGRFLPVHFVGGLVEGVLPASGLNLNYKAGLGNGRATAISRGGDAGDNNGSRAWLANAYVKPDALYGLETGGSVYGDTVTLASSREFSERIVSAYAVWNKEDPELIAEFAAVRHVEAGASAAQWSRAFYLQAAYRLTGEARLWKPYFRFEHVGIDRADAMFETVQALDLTLLGARYDLSGFAAAKAEYRTWTRGPGSTRNHGAFAQLCFTF